MQLLRASRSQLAIPIFVLVRPRPGLRSYSTPRGRSRLIHLGVDRVLTSGAARTASEGAERIGWLVIQAERRIEILAGGGIDGDTVARLVRDTGVREVHLSARDAAKVQRVVRSLRAEV